MEITKHNPVNREQAFAFQFEDDAKKLQSLAMLPSKKEFYAFLKDHLEAHIENCKGSKDDIVIDDVRYHKTHTEKPAWSVHVKNDFVGYTDTLGRIEYAINGQKLEL